MKQIRIFSLLAIIAIVWSCSSDDERTDYGVPVPVQFSSGNVATLRTSVDNTEETQWTTDDRIGIFMIKHDYAPDQSAIAENATNKQYQPVNGGVATSSFNPVSPEQAIYYPQNGDNVDFIAYYPYQPAMNNMQLPEIDITDQSKPDGLDFLFAYTNPGQNTHDGYNKNSSTVDLQFNHVMSKLSFILKAGTGLQSSDLNGIEIEIGKIFYIGGFSLTSGKVVAKTSSTTKNITANTAPNGLSSSAIVLPQESFSDEKLVITLTNGETFEWEFAKGNNDIDSWQEGKNHLYTITVSRTGITVTTGEITDWTGTNTPPTEGSVGFWKVGDYYPDPKAVYSGGTLQSGTAAIGIVYWVDPADSRHGKVVSLDEAEDKKWAETSSFTGAADMNNGRVNMKAIYGLDNDFSDYPAFAWVHSKNSPTQDYDNTDAKGIWYLPAGNELGNNDPSSLFQNMNTYGRVNFNKKLTAANGTQLGNNYYWSSSEDSGDEILITNFLGGHNSISPKNLDLRVRAILTF